MMPQITDFELPYTKDGELYGDLYIDQFFRPYKNQTDGHITEHLKKFKESTNPVGVYQYYKNNDGCTLITWSVDYDFPPTFYILKDKDSETRGFLLYTIDNQVMFRAVEEHTEFATTVRINDKSFIFPPSDKWHTRTVLEAEDGTEWRGEMGTCSAVFEVDKGIDRISTFPEGNDPHVTLSVKKRRRDSLTSEHYIYSNGLLTPLHWTEITRSYHNTSIPTVTHYNSGEYSPTEFIREHNMFWHRYIDNYYSASGELVCRTSERFRTEEFSGVVENIKDSFIDFISEFRGTNRKTELDSIHSSVQLGLREMFTPGIIVIDGDNRTTVSKNQFVRWTDSGSFTNTPKPKQLFLFDRKLEPIKVTMTNGSKEIVDFSPVKRLATESK